MVRFFGKLCNLYLTIQLVIARRFPPNGILLSFFLDYFSYYCQASSMKCFLSSFSSSDFLGTDIANDGNVSFVFSRFLFIAAAETTRRYRIVFPVNLIREIARSDVDANREREKEVDISGKYIVPSS